MSAIPSWAESTASRSLRSTGRKMLLDRLSRRFTLIRSTSCSILMILRAASFSAPFPSATASIMGRTSSRQSLTFSMCSLSRGKGDWPNNWEMVEGFISMSFRARLQRRGVRARPRPHRNHYRKPE